MSQHSPKQWFQLEDLFFNEVDQHLLEKLRAEMKTDETAESISRVTGINDSTVAKAIAELDVSTDTLAAFRLAPLVAVAWADDRVEENERYRILQAAEKAGIRADEPAMQLLKNWTEKRPPAALLDAWCDYSAALCASLNESHRATLKTEVLSQVTRC